MKTIRNTIAAIILLPLLFSSCSNPELPAAAGVDLDRFMGKWFEIAALPGGINRGCTCTTFDYKLSKDRDHVMIINSCIKKGKPGAVLAKGYVVENSGGAKWKLQLFWPFRDDYYIIAVADDYSYAMAGNPDRNSLWIMSRNPVLESTAYNGLVEKAQTLGFDTKQLVRTIRDCNLR